MKGRGAHVLERLREKRFTSFLFIFVSVTVVNWPKRQAPNVQLEVPPKKNKKGEDIYMKGMYWCSFSTTPQSSPLRRPTWGLNTVSSLLAICTDVCTVVVCCFQRSSQLCSSTVTISSSYSLIFPTLPVPAPRLQSSFSPGSIQMQIKR